MLRFVCLTITLTILHAGESLACDSQWRVGDARVNITPELPIWLSGYGARTRPATEKLDDLWAKALVLQDATGRRVVLVTMDLVGIDRELSQDVCRQLQENYDLPRSAIALAASHTHSGPVVGGNLEALYSLDEEQTGHVEDYAVELSAKLVEVVGDAIESLAPARLSWGSGNASFAVNRRNNPEAEVAGHRQQGTLVGPVDHNVPVLAVHDENGALRAGVAGYACHATVLSGYQVSGDWPGAAQREFEKRHPGAIALFWAGCGGDQNPLPRRSVELMRQYGQQLADAMDEVVSGKLTPISSELQFAYKEFDLPFGELPSRAELELAAAGGPPEQAWARYLLTHWDRDGGLPSTYPYPVQAWHLGKDISWLFLGGEVVVDYALRLKSELGGETVWVASYANDVMGYIPNRRVLTEGGYEGGGARFPYGLPAVWSPNVEQHVVEAAREVHAAVSD